MDAAAPKKPHARAVLPLASLLYNAALSRAARGAQDKEAAGGEEGGAQAGGGSGGGDTAACEVGISELTLAAPMLGLTRRIRKATSLAMRSALPSPHHSGEEKGAAGSGAVTAPPQLAHMARSAAVDRRSLGRGPGHASWQGPGGGHGDHGGDVDVSDDEDYSDGSDDDEHGGGPEGGNKSQAALVCARKMGQVVVRVGWRWVDVLSSLMDLTGLALGEAQSCIAMLAEPGGLFLDVKSAYTKPLHLRTFASTLMGAGVHVRAVCSFSPSQIRFTQPEPPPGRKSGKGGAVSPPPSQPDVSLLEGGVSPSPSHQDVLRQGGDGKSGRALVRVGGNLPDPASEWPGVVGACKAASAIAARVPLSAATTTSTTTASTAAAGGTGNLVEHPGLLHPSHPLHHNFFPHLHPRQRWHPPPPPPPPFDSVLFFHGLNGGFGLGDGRGGACEGAAATCG